MAIDVAAMGRHGRNQILHLPVSCRIPAVVADPDEGIEAQDAGQPFPAAFANGTGNLLGVDGGIVYDRGGSLTISKVDWPTALVEQTFVEMQMRDASWKLFSVNHVSGAESPNATEVNLIIGPPNN